MSYDTSDKLHNVPSSSDYILDYILKTGDTKDT